MISPKLPDELITYIILQLDLADMFQCLTVSKNMNALIQTSSVIQYKVELAAYKLLPCADTTFSAAEALRWLRAQQEAWRRCKWSSETHVALGGVCRTYELRSGVWAYGYGDPAPATNAPSALPADSTTTITCYRLPSARGGGGDGAAQWTLKDLGMAVRDFTMDPLMDLLVLVEQTPHAVRCPFRVHFRKLSDGQPHEMAAKHVVDVEMSSADPTTASFGVQVYGTHVGLLVRQDVHSGNYDHLAIWDWRTGVIEMDMDAIVCSFDDFVFLDDARIMVAALRSPVALEIWKFDDVPDKTLEKPEPTFVGSFSLPQTKRQNAYMDMHFDGNASVTLAGAKTLDGTPFAPGPESPIFAISFAVLMGDQQDFDDDEVTGFTMVMRPDIMLAIMENEKIKVDELDWERWGPESTRWLPHDPDNLNWEPCSFGGRYAAVGPRELEADEEDDDDDDEAQVIRIYDFRPDVLARYGYERDNAPEICVGPWVVPKGTMFVKDIVSKLPYHLATSVELTTPLSGVMMDEGRLICTQAEDDDEWRTLIVLTF